MAVAAIIKAVTVINFKDHSNKNGVKFFFTYFIELRIFGNCQSMEMSN